MTYSRRLLLNIALVNLFVTLLAAVSAFQGYQQYQERARMATHNLAAALENHLVDAIRRADISLLSVIDLLEHERMDAAHLNYHIELLRSRLPEVEAIRITDRDGNLILGTGVAAAKRINLADRPHFIQLRDDPSDELVLSKPQISRVNNSWVIVMARRTTRVDGSFNGMIFATVPLEYFTHLFSRLDLGFNGVAFLRDADMGLISRYPIINTLDMQVGKPFATPELAALLAAGKTQGSYFSSATPDKIDRMLSFRKLEHYPLFAFIGMAADDYLAPWRIDTQRLAILVLLFITGSAYAYRIQLRAWQRQQEDHATIERQEALYHELVEDTPVMVMRYQPDTSISFANTAFATFLGTSANALIGQRWLDFLPEATDQAAARTRIDALTPAAPSVSNVVVRVRALNGQMRWTQWTDRAIFDANGRLIHLQSVGEDITERKRIEAELVEMATTDFLTGLLNRRNFLSAMEEELNRLKRFDIPRAAVLMLDLDHFKRVNDTYGHAAGDAVLKHFAGLIRAELRKVDNGGRLGGEEFAILLLGAELDAAQAFAERLRNTLSSTPLSFEGQRITITVSIGIAMLSPDDVGPDDALMRADKALYEAKHNGRNRVCCAPSREESQHGHPQATDPAAH